AVPSLQLRTGSTSTTRPTVYSISSSSSTSASGAFSTRTPTSSSRSAELAERALGAVPSFCDTTRVFRWLRSLFGRGRRDEASPTRDAEAHARSYGERSGEIVSVARQEPKPIPRRTGDMTGELLRRAFEAKLQEPSKTPTRAPRLK